MPRTPRLLVAALLALLLSVAAACGGAADDSGAKPLGAAEPANAPATSRTPAGTTKPVGARPQGIVYDARTDLLAVAVRDPYRLLLLDPTTLAVRRSVALPGKVRHLQLAPGGPVLVPAESANQVIEVTLPDGTTRATDVERQPHDAAGASNGDLLVGNEFSGSVSVVRDGRVVTTFDDLEQPGGVITDGATVAVVDVRAFTLSTYDLRTDKRTGRVAAGRGPTHIVGLGDGRVAVTDTRGGQVLIYSLAPLKQLGTLRLAGGPYGVTSDPTTDTVWVTLTAKNQLVGLDVSGDTPRVVATYPTVRQGDTVAVAPGSRTVWVTGTADGTVQRITR